MLFFGQVVFCKTPAGTTADGFTRKNVFKSLFGFFVLKAVPKRCSTTKRGVLLQQVYCRASTRIYNFRKTLQMLSNVTQRCSLLSSILQKSMCINEQAELNIAKEN